MRNQIVTLMYTYFYCRLNKLSSTQYLLIHLYIFIIYLLFNVIINIFINELNRHRFIFPKLIT